MEPTTLADQSQRPILHKSHNLYKALIQVTKYFDLLPIIICIKDKHWNCLRTEQTQGKEYMEQFI